MSNTFVLRTTDAELAELLPASETGAEFASLLRRLRERACFTQEELAERSGLSVRAISDLERGRTSTPRRNSVALLAAALRVEAETLENFRRVTRRRIGPPTLRSAPSVAVADSATCAGRADATGSPSGLSRVVQWMHQILIEEPAAQGRWGRSTPATPRLVELVGASSAGIASIAVQAAARFRSHFPDGHFYVSAESGVPGPDALIGPLSRVFGISHAPSGLSDRVGRIRSVLHSHRALLVLDNILDAAQLRSLVTPGGASAVIVLTPRRLAVCDGTWTIHVPHGGA